MGVFCDRVKLGSTAALDCLTGQNKGRYIKEELLLLLILLVDSNRWHYTNYLMSVVPLNNFPPRIVSPFFNKLSTYIKRGNYSWSIRANLVYRVSLVHSSLRVTRAFLVKYMLGLLRVYAKENCVFTMADLWVHRDMYDLYYHCKRFDNELHYYVFLHIFFLFDFFCELRFTEKKVYRKNWFLCLTYKMMSNLLLKQFPV